MELALVVVLGADLPASELESLIKPVDCVECGEHVLEVDVDCAVLVALIQLDMRNLTKLGLLASAP